MRFHLAFLTGLTGLIGFFAYLVLSFSENSIFYFNKDKKDLSEVLANFQKINEPSVIVNLSTLYGKRGQLQVLHPMLDVRQLSVETARLVCNGEMRQDLPVLGSAASCHRTSSNESEDVSASSRRKTEILARFLNDNESLPEKFLASSPFVDLHGNSYAYLLMKKGSGPYNTKTWIEQHLSYLKMSELREVLDTYQIENPVYRFIASLSDAEIEMAVRGEPLVLTPSHLLVRDQSRYGFSPLSYLVYDLRLFEETIRTGNYAIGFVSGESYCVQRMGNACWTYNSRYAFSYIYRYSVAVLIILGAVFAIFMAFYVRRIYEKNKEQQKHRLSLQVLSHEFRTPVSSLILMIDQMRNSSNWSDGENDLVTRMSMEIFRLQRIVEVSKTYLQAEGGRIPFNDVDIPSINQWICDFIAETNLNIQWKPLETDQGIVADPFWLKFILSSLVQNAFIHGAEPVTICLEHNKGQVQIKVQDQGVCEYTSLSKMTEAFVKSRTSKGMGLGLNIVKYIVEEWGGEIRFSNAPTSFTLSFGKNKMRTT
ncbi:sensor histidine kinase [Bdellovibrio sp. HCB337]|uniref:sensor histidine kinase n=1 Tax=Bdellovibrio sp. HCB337 TaxID=3394358 RepID=UPI0039A7251A